MRSAGRRWFEGWGGGRTGWRMESEPEAEGNGAGIVVGGVELRARGRRESSKECACVTM